MKWSVFNSYFRDRRQGAVDVSQVPSDSENQSKTLSRLCGLCALLRCASVTRDNVCASVRSRPHGRRTSAWSRRRTPHDQIEGGREGEGGEARPFG